MWRDTGRSRGNVRDPHPNVVTRPAIIKVDVLAVGVNCFAGVNGEPLGTAVEISF